MLFGIKGSINRCIVNLLNIYVLAFVEAVRQGVFDFSK
jgi:hypothetical protein